ncbi:DUF58 domain-containing protein [bacterium]|nr:DUF58 domain-containing protein [bacterium]
MTFRPLIFLIFLGSLSLLWILIILFRRASIEGKFLLITAVGSMAAYMHIHFYLLLLTSLSLFTFLALALAWTWIASSRLKFKREVKAEVMAGENVQVKYLIKTGAFLPLYHSRIWDRAWRIRSDDTEEEIQFEDPGYIGFLRIHPRDKSEGIQHIVPPVRGRLNFGPVGIEGGDPFGLFTTIRWLPIGDECLVLPTWVLLHTLPSIPARLGAREQEHLVSKEGFSHEFLGIRPWTDGDSLRGVHWVLTAKHNALIVRQFEKEVEEELLIILDADRAGDVGEGAENALEYLITLTMSIINAAIEVSRPWNLVIVDENQILINYKMTDPLRQVQYALAELGAKRVEPIENLLEGIRSRYPGSACVLLTPRIDQAVSVELEQSDQSIGDNLQSILVRVDPDSFVTSVSSGIKTLRYRKGRDERPSAFQPDRLSRISEITINRGDNLEDLFNWVVPT